MFLFDKLFVWLYFYKMWGIILFKELNGVISFNDKKLYLDERIKDVGCLFF